MYVSYLLVLTKKSLICQSSDLFNLLHKSLFLFLLYVDTHPCYAEETRGEVSSIEVCKTCSAGVVADGEESALEDLSTFFAAAAKRRGAAAQFVGGGFMVRIIYY